MPTARRMRAMDQHSPNHPRRVRSFVRRPGRMTTSQSRALEDLWPIFGIDWRVDGSADPTAEGADACEQLDLEAVFGRLAPVVLEIGYGNGDTLVARAASDPDRNYLGIEVHEPGVGHCLIRAQEAGVTNLRLLQRDAIDVLRNGLASATLARVNLYFPDPWPKKRHHKRRIVQSEFLALVAGRLRDEGTLCIATDWAGYAEHIDDVIETDRHFRLVERREHDGDQPIDRLTTKFERRGLARGHRIVDWRLTRDCC